eukprot:363580-Chlamydomonas_euryale.AAC.10
MPCSQRPRMVAPCRTPGTRAWQPPPPPWHPPPPLPPPHLAPEHSWPPLAQPSALRPLPRPKPTSSLHMHSRVEHGDDAQHDWPNACSFLSCPHAPKQPVH